MEATNHYVAQPPQGVFTIAEPKETCPICKGYGWLQDDVPVGHPDFNRLFPCQCIQGQLEANRLRRVHVAAGLPPDQQSMTFDNFVPGQAVRLDAPDQHDRSTEASRIRVRIQKLRQNRTSLPDHLDRAKARCLDFARQPQGFLTLLGEAGCGKTHLASAIANYRLARGQVTQFSVVPDLLDHLRATFKPDSGVSYDARFEAYKTTPLLILDDLGTEHETSWASEKLYQLINYRYNWHLPVVITSNELPTHLDLRLQSRLFDLRRNCVFEILAGDYRMRGR